MAISHVENSLGMQQYQGMKRKDLQGMQGFDGMLKAGMENQAHFRSKELVSGPQVPYGHRARNGVIDYKGVVFVCDYENNAICLGDMSNKDNVLNISLSGGGVLRVNRDNIDSLAGAIGMFSPEDVNLILRAIAKDKMCREKLKEIEDNKNRIGEGAEEENK